MNILDEFRTFIARGNVVDLAVGVVVGAAFTRIVSSLVEDLLMPPIGLIAGKLDFTNFYLPLSATVTDAVAKSGGALPLAEAKKVGAVLAYGSFITVLINFVIVSFCIFLVVKAVNRLKQKQEAGSQSAPPPPPDVVLLTEIRDLLKASSAERGGERSRGGL